LCGRQSCLHPPFQADRRAELAHGERSSPLEIGHLRRVLARQILLDFFFQMLYSTRGGF
jgi:hypothetical protein